MKCRLGCPSGDVRVRLWAERREFDRQVFGIMAKGSEMNVLRALVRLGTCVLGRGRG